MTDTDEAAPELLIEHDDGVLLLTLNRPQRGNAYTEELRDRLHAALREAQRDTSVRTVVLTGAGKHFCTGIDLEGSSDRGPAQFRANLLRLNWIDEFRRIPVPVIAAIEGYAAGAGVGLALACDVRVMAENSHLYPAFAERGLAPDNGVAWLLTRMVGPGRAMRWLLDAARIPAEEALVAGLAQEVVPPGQVLERAMEMARKWASGPTVALHLTKRQVWQALDYRLSDSLLFEQDAQYLLNQTEDRDEGRLAFREKRAPEFKGR